jgi:toxin ParE1/3/4
VKARWASLAQRDLTAIADWISAESPASAAKVGARIRDAASKLTTHPLIGRPGTVVGTREKLALPYPYIIVYEVRDDLNEVWILRVFHMAQDRP